MINIISVYTYDTDESIDRYIEYKLDLQFREVCNREITLMLTLCTYTEQTRIISSLKWYTEQRPESFQV